MAERIKGILFDLGDTLLDFGHVDVVSLFEAGARLAYQYLLSLHQPLPPFAKFHRRQLWAVRWSYFKSHITRKEFSSLELIGRLGSDMGHNLSTEQLNELAWLWYEPLSRCATMEPVLIQSLKHLQDHGLTLALVSNTFIPAVVLDRHLRQAGLLEFFPVRVYSCDVFYRKPHPGIFRAALERTGLRACEALFVGDSPKADIAGANGVGMISVLKDPRGLHAHSSIRPRHTVKSIAELPAIVDGYGE
ncbi:MAG: HAD family hydrolase [Phycisphaerae bacterium]|jgi:putative hydrolase of the HAD superfamily